MSKRNQLNSKEKINILELLNKMADAIEDLDRSTPKYASIDELGRVIKEERKIQKIKLRDLAELSGLSIQTLVNIEHGKKSVSLENVEVVLKVLGKTLWIQ